MTTNREAWLNLTKEKPMEPGLPICDPHHHFYEHPGERYLVEDLLKDIADNNILKTVYMECGTGYRQKGPESLRPVGETEFVIAQSEKVKGGKTDVAAGIVGYADLTLGPAVEPVLEAHIAAGKGRFRGIRHLAAWDASPEIQATWKPPNDKRPRGVLLDPKVRQGFASLKKYNLSFDAWLYHPQLPELLDLVKAFPDTRIIINHVGGPLGFGPYTGKQAEIFKWWQPTIAAFASYPNVFVKLGGLGMWLNGFGWDKRATPPNSADLAHTMAPYYLWCIEKFGVGRCMFESNFPPDKMSYSYTVMWNAFKRIAAGFSTAERNALFYGTAVKAYRLTEK